MTLPWRKYVLWFAQEHIEFRKAEIESILKLKNICMNFVVDVKENEPFWIVELPNDEAAKKLASRSVSLRCILEYWTHSTQYDQFHKNVDTYIKNNFKSISNLFNETKTFKITVETFNKHFTQKEKVEKIELFDYLPVKGNVDLKQPDIDWWYIEYYGIDPVNVPSEPLYTFFGRWIADGQRALIKEISLKRRKFIGNTTMDPQLSLLMANQAMAKNGDIVLDPFVGTGSLLVAAAKFGAFVIGADIDFLMLHGRTKPSRISQKIREKDECVEANLKQYQCESQYIDVLVSDFSLEIWNERFKLDSIVTDPPYGIREATEKVETKVKTKRKDKKLMASKIKIEQMHHTGEENSTVIPHFPSTSSYNLDELFYDLLKFSAKHLTLSGRLVCWIPVFRDDYCENDLPKHKCLKIISNSEQILSGFASRRLLTYEKVLDYTKEIELTDSLERNGMDFRAKYFYHGEETRKERRVRRVQLKEIGRQEALKRGKVISQDGKVVKTLIVENDKK